jgi:DNA (cytosine-5)-methyltransferase 1
MSGHPAPSREAGQKAAPTVTQGAPFSRTGNQRVEAEAIVAQCPTTRTGSAYDPTTETLPVAFGAKNSANQGDSVSTQVTPTLDKSKTPAVAIQAQALKEKQPKSQGFGIDDSDVSYTLTSGDRHAVCAPLNTQLGLRGPDTSNSSREGVGIGKNGDPSFTLQAAHSHAVIIPAAVRRLTPIECERLQGFPDDFTQIPWRNKPAEDCPDGPRYKAMGNSMAVPVMRWIGERIQMVESLDD